ncbi:UDP-glucuronosyl/UDP-glucosyltransferase [Artemisia annua]|uniref:UDP-glucuronosyl/UDP-glucosyltransferase n=1 Tax=Artemisia annua TaxID=35608 RepID=A0A2U1P870_ARTAN|nr:UDP-glucuronosyl/UDP-glucosyltransferase [Artemisia annua]
MNPNGGDTIIRSTQPTATRRRIILFPLPWQGHITPMLQLGNILHNHGFKIIFLHAEFNSPSYTNYPHFTFKTITDHVSEINHVPKTPPDPTFIITYLNENCVDSFTDCLNELLAEPNEPPVACLITDAEYYFAQDVADSMKIPRLVTWACTIASVLVYGDLLFFYEKGYFNFTKKDPGYEAPMPKYPLLKVKDIIKITPNPKGLGEYLTKVVKQIKASSGIIWNSFIQLEEPTLETLNQDFPIPKFSLGPLHMYFPVSPSSVLDQDRTFFTWLDGQAPKSVLYMSFGSVARISKLEFLEVAYALANIDIPFLWVVRPGWVEGSEWLELLPDKFLEEVGDRGRIVKWCPQNEVLAHPSIGCFWTHSGWNSTLECIREGVPMICAPCVVGQPIIAR